MTVRDGGDDDLPPEKRPSPSSLIDTADSFQPVAQSLGGVQGALFKGHPAGWLTAVSRAAPCIPLGELNALLMLCVKSAFALLLARVTEPAASRRKEI